MAQEQQEQAVRPACRAKETRAWSPPLFAVSKHTTTLPDALLALAPPGIPPTPLTPLSAHPHSFKPHLETPAAHKVCGCSTHPPTHPPVHVLKVQGAAQPKVRHLGNVTAPVHLVRLQQHVAGLQVTVHCGRKWEGGQKKGGSVGCQREPRLKLCRAAAHARRRPRARQSSACAATSNCHYSSLHQERGWSTLAQLNSPMLNSWM